MADSLHLALAAFRDTMLTAVARLEFAIRDTENSSVSQEPDKVDPRVTNHLNVLGRDLDTLSSRHSAELDKVRDDIAVMKYDIGILIKDKISLYAAVQGIQEQMASLLKATEETKELLKIPAPTTTRNILVSTPALTAAVAAIATQPPEMVLDDEDSSEVEDKKAHGSQEQDVEMEAEAEEEESDGLSELRQVTIKGKQYFMDAENSVYVETDEGYEEIGKYNPTLDRIEGAEEEEVEEEEEEEEEEGIEVEEFVYKGKTYQRDNENNVYDDGEHIGTWNGKKIIPLA